MAPFGKPRRVAVIGGGVAGLTAAYLLQREYDVTVFEAGDRLGGHAHTHDVASGGHSVAVDSGFIVFNERTYPMLVRLLGELGVASQETEMSLSVMCRGCGLEYAGARKLPGLFARPANAAAPRFLRLLAQVPVFHREARALLDTPEGETEPTLGEFLTAGGFSDYFIQHFAVPLVSAVWSCGTQAVGDYPARYLFSFLANHGMLSVSGSPTWRTVVGGSRTYVDLIAKRLAAVHTSTPVRAITRTAAGVSVRDDADEVAHFDAVVIATHADQALALLAEPTETERAVLGAFSYSLNPTVLHTDTGVLPRRGNARASWNHLMPSCHPQPGGVKVSYHMNRLQRLDVADDFIVTLNPGDEVDQRRVIASMLYEHPIYTPASLAAQRRLPELTTSTVAFAGAYHGWGFHEDGCRSGVAAARALGVRW